MTIQKDYDLTDLSTFHVKVKAKLFCEINTEQDFLDLIQTDEYKNNQKLFIGGASNILFTKDFDGIVVCNRLKGIEITIPTSKRVGTPTGNVGEDFVYIKAMGGEIWHDFVLFAVNKNYWGVENLSLVPGTVGAAPVQNIGAYGTEVKDTIENVEALDVETGSKTIFSKDECEFAYRESVFKNKLKGKYFITAVVFKLSKIPKTNITYRALKDYLEKNNLTVKNAKDVSDIVSEIRRTKLPDPKVLGSAGSFFKNVYVDSAKLAELKKEYETVPAFEENGKIKIPSGWLIEQCGWKGKRVGNVGVHDKQALVLVNHGGATGEEVLALANEIVDSVYKKFGLKISPEVNLI
ncbi:MAG TPA: UDP-N-acetylmuramate dehydrogenase [Candidatus Paceibacterota bacterium]|nr:UDP-N-acetylmuramate dehydrogenase [Candidatus Paceibacterota bacterium]